MQSVYRCRDCRVRFWVINRGTYFLAGISALVLGVTIAVVIVSFAMLGEPRTWPSPVERVPQAAFSLKETLARAQANDAAAEYFLSKRFSHGDEVAMSREEAIHWLQRAAMHGYPQAQLDYGLALRRGEGMTQDWKESANWIQRAAESGYALAQKELAIMYMNGSGVPQDNSRAYLWLIIAAATGADGASILRDALARKFSPREIEQLQAEARAYAEAHSVQTVKSTSSVSPEDTK